ncbi:15-hydroxyprostaglandin dehydrogenase [NAD(+)]-like isoform X1 [Mucor ambiguus]|uniref:15-hydroxyprostaglandin dehydrogenase [NAD(+)]-like isoform X1 n=1 Tax=Mucor ambiguus TaxID=91626 RepID=A0A0C9M5Y0_9FUNG|nr:15-hydroxyprostaglandin dehydrogenase [NAD(+)]-like isoform X1 [Mucor ambiguus]
MSNNTFNLAMIRGKVAVITGGSRGIGKSVADVIIANGGMVIIGDLLEKEGKSVVAEYNERAGKQVAAFIRTDVTKYSDNMALFQLAEKEFGGVDYALLNAGIGYNANSMFSPLDDKMEEKVMQVNTIGVIKGTKVALLHMAKRGGGSIVHVASAAGFFSSPGLASYNASKHAVIGYTRSFQLMPYICNVRVNALCPYWVDTDLLATVKTTDNQEEPFYNVIKHSPRVPMKTVVEGVMTLFTDTERNTETLLATPEGTISMETPHPPDSFQSKEANNAFKKYIQDAIPLGKAQLKQALQRYESSNSKL